MTLTPFRACCAAVALLCSCAVVTAAPVISEFSASTASTDVEYVEFFSTPGADLSAYWVLQIEGDASAPGIIDSAFRLGTANAEGLYLLNLAANTLENGSLSLLLVQGFAGSVGQDLDTGNTGAFDIQPWLALLDSVAVSDGGIGDIVYSPTVLGVGFGGLAFAPGGASRTAQGWVRNDFDLAGIPGFAGTPVLGEAYNTPGACNRIVIDLGDGTFGPSDCVAVVAQNSVSIPGTLGLAVLGLGLMRGVSRRHRRASGP